MWRISRNYINGEWVAPVSDTMIPIISPASEEHIGELVLSSEKEVQASVEAAVRACTSFSKSTVPDRISALESILAEYEKRREELAEAIMMEMGAPISLAEGEQVHSGIAHLTETISALRDSKEPFGNTNYQANYFPIGVVGLIAPWNWPINQVMCKVAPAIAAGCTVVLKPSEYAPLSAKILAEVIDASQVPNGVFNMIFGLGETVGQALCEHPDVDMISFTGSTKAGVKIAISSAPTIKRVCQELGGKSPIILTDDYNIDDVVAECVWLCMENSGQSCNAGTRLLVPQRLHDKVARLAVASINKLKVGDPKDPDTRLGPVANKAQCSKILSVLKKVEREGNKPIVGGYVEACEMRNQPGYYIPPTAYAGVCPNSYLAQEEVFGPVLAIIPFSSDEEAIRIANDSPYGLSAYLYGRDEKLLHQLGEGIRAGMIHINGAQLDYGAPFGGVKGSGNGREWGLAGIREFQEVKAIFSRRKPEGDLNG